MEKHIATLRELFSLATRGTKSAFAKGGFWLETAPTHWKDDFCAFLRRARREDPTHYHDVLVPYCEQHFPQLPPDVQELKVLDSLDSLKQWVELAPFGYYHLRLSDEKTLKEPLQWLKPLSRVRTLSLGFSPSTRSLAGVISCGYLQHLQHLHLNGYRMDSGSLRHVIRALPPFTLRSLHIKNLKLLKRDLQFLAKAETLQGLQYLWLDNAQNLELLGSSKTLGALRFLGFEHTVERAVVDAFARSSCLRHLEGICLRHVTPAALRALVDPHLFPELQALLFASHSLNNHHLEAIANTSSHALRCLYFHGDGVQSQIDDEGVKRLASSPALEGLEGLYVLEERLDNEGVEYLAHSAFLSNLSVLQLGGRFRERALEQIARTTTLSQLQALWLFPTRELLSDSYMALACSKTLPKSVRRDMLSYVKRKRVVERARALGVEVTPRLDKRAILSRIWQAQEEEGQK